MLLIEWAESHVMTVSEYEERLQFSAPSLHETFVAMHGRSRRRRFWAAVALAGGILAANEIAPHHSAHDGTHSPSQMSHSDLGSIAMSPAPLRVSSSSAVRESSE